MSGRRRRNPFDTGEWITLEKVAPECEALAAEVEALKAKIKNWQTQLQSGDYPGNKSELTTQIKEAQADLAQKKAELAECIAEHPLPPEKPPPGLPPECRELAGEVAILESKIKTAQESLKTAPPALKSTIAAKIKNLQAALATKKAQLAACINPPERNVETAELVPPPFRDPCEELKKKIAGLEAKLISLGEQMDTAPPALKSIIAEQIKETTKERDAAWRDYEECAIDHGGRDALQATFAGRLTVTETSNDQIPTPLSVNVTFGMLFHEFFHEALDVNNFAAIQLTYDTGTSFGSNTTTVTLNNGIGTYDPANGTTTITASVHLAHTIDLAGDSDVLLHFSTGNQAGDFRMNAAGELGMSVTDAVFEDGYLDGDTVSMVLVGMVVPHPFVQP
jgi:hypothetical protein